MNSNFWDVIKNDLERNELIYLLGIYNSYTNSNKKKIDGKFSGFINSFDDEIHGIDYFNDDLSDIQLIELLSEKINEAYKFKKN